MNEQQQQQQPQVIYYMPYPQERARSTTDNFFSIVAILIAVCLAAPILLVALAVGAALTLDGLAGALVGIPIALVGAGVAWLIVWGAAKI